MQSRFSLEQATAKLAHINIRDEKHGEETVPACDLKIQLTDSNTALSMFHPTLRSFLYKPEESPNESVEGVDPSLSVRRFGSLIERLRLDHKLVGADVSIGFGTGGTSDITLDTVDVDGFSVELMEGGSVCITFKVKARPTGEQMRKIYEVIGCEIDITVTPAAERQSALALEGA